MRVRSRRGSRTAAVAAGVLLAGWVVAGPPAPAVAGPPSSASSVAAVSHRAGAIASGGARVVRLRPRELGLPPGSLSGGGAAVSDSGRYVAGSATFDSFGRVSHAVVSRQHSCPQSLESGSGMVMQASRFLRSHQADLCMNENQGCT
jgi:hypothetical protein